MDCYVLIRSFIPCFPNGMENNHQAKSELLIVVSSDILESTRTSLLSLPCHPGFVPCLLGCLTFKEQVARHFLVLFAQYASENNSHSLISKEVMAGNFVEETF